MYKSNVVMIYLAVINIAAFLAYSADKKRAKRNEWRISEKTLFLLAFIGGSPGAFLGMQVFRHKTKKTLFRIGIPCILFVHTAIAVWWILK